MKYIALILTSLAASLAISSCSGDDGFNAPDDIRHNDSRLITIRTNMPGVSSRGAMVDKIDSCIVSIYNANNPHRNPDQADDKSFNPWYLTELFKVVPGGDGFTNDSVIWPEKDSPETGGDYGEKPLLFYAHYPDMGEGMKPVNNSTYTSADNFSVEYVLDEFAVDGDISKHIDFMTAFAEVGIPVNPNDSRIVNLDFNHQLSAIEIKAKGQHLKYNIEIAGVKIGNVIDKAKFSFQSKHNAQGKLTSSNYWVSGSWNENKTEFIQSRNPVAYIHADESEHVTPVKDTAKSLMGKGGLAMIIPFRASAWDNVNDPGNKGKGTYFSVLIHVTDKEGKQVFPYTSESQIPYGYQPGLRVAETLQGKDYGWAAIPVSVNLFPGKKYSYTLDFTKGIGVLPPDDPDPGKPIVANDHITVSLKVYDWVEEEISITPDFGNIGTDDTGTGESEK